MYASEFASGAAREEEEVMEDMLVWCVCEDGPQGERSVVADT